MASTSTMTPLTIDERVINALKDNYIKVIEDIIMECGNHYGFSGKEAMERLGLNRSATTIQIEKSMVTNDSKVESVAVVAAKDEKPKKVSAAAEEKAAKKAAAEAEKAAKKAALEEEKAAKKAALEAEKAAKKAALEAEKAAKKAEKKTATQSPKTKKNAQEEKQEEEQNDEEQPKVLKVKKFEHNGVKYLKTADNVLYLMETQEEVGKWNEEKQIIEFKESSEEDEDEDDDDDEEEKDDGDEDEEEEAEEESN